MSFAPHPDRALDDGEIAREDAAVEIRNAAGPAREREPSP
jgi:hypothetical protein